MLWALFPTAGRYGMIENSAAMLPAHHDTKDKMPMIRNWNSTRRGGVLVALLLSLLLTLSACGGVASSTVAPTVAPAIPTATSAVAAATSTPLAATPTVASVAATGAAAPTTAPPIAAPATATGPAATAAVPPTVTIAPTATVAPTPTIAPTVAPTVGAAPRAGQPVRIQIPSIKVDAAIEYVGLTSEGNMDIPKNYDNTAWYAPGARPGDVGNAAIAGHVDSKTGKAVFWDLAKLKPGDEIFVVGDDGVTRRFVVASRDSYERTNAPLQQIFGPTSERHLNIITCDRTTPFSNGTYAANVVVYTTSAP